jgi:ubiquinone/menaquinone biosynthesis C-methylase UbiE
MLLGASVRPRARRRTRLASAASLAALWTVVHRRYRDAGRRQARAELDLLRAASWEAYTRHYNENVPTVEEEFDIWGKYHQHRHEMRYDLVAAAVREHLPLGGIVVDIGCGSALVADRIAELQAEYVGLEFGAHQLGVAAEKSSTTSSRPSTLHRDLARGDAAALPLRDGQVDLVVMSEVIEHLLRPEQAVWEVARVLRPGGVLVMTTNNASEMPLRSPLSHPFAWIEKALGFHHPTLISNRPWVWPDAVQSSLLPPGSPPMHLPHTHHKQGETRRLFDLAGLETFHASSFEFPPPQSATARWLESHGQRGRRVVDGIEAVAQRVPLLNRLGCHLFMLARKVGDPVSPVPPAGAWPGPFSP